ncbi:sensor histidine kinase [Geodermatophilus sp. SYSU D00703]
MVARVGTRGTRSPGNLTALVAVAGAAVTLAVAGLPFVRFAYHAPALHVALETTDALVALLVSFLLLGRFRQSRSAQDLCLLLALGTVAVANLVLGALPGALFPDDVPTATDWASLVVRLLGSGLIATAALVRRGTRVPPRVSVLLVAAVPAAVAVATLGALALSASLPSTVVPRAGLGDASTPVLDGHPLVLAVQAVGAVLYGVAAAAFARRAEGSGDELLRWVAAGCALGAFARVHYLLYPSLYTEYVYVGDVLRLGSYLLMLVGASREIRSYWELRSQAAVLEARRRMARDLHDGLAQELAFISSQSRRLATTPGDPVAAERLGAAAARALDEARRAIAALTRPVDEPFAETLRRQVDDLAGRYDVDVHTHVDGAVEVSPARAEALLRILSEAVRNAVRHGRASCVRVTLQRDPPGLTVTDDGCGFTMGTRSNGGFGLTSMRERAAGVGAELQITSSPGLGTSVEVRWP